MYPQDNVEKPKKLNKSKRADPSRAKKDETRPTERGSVQTYEHESTKKKLAREGKAGVKTVTTVLSKFNVPSGTDTKIIDTLRDNYFRNKLEGVTESNTLHIKTYMILGGFKQGYIDFKNMFEGISGASDESKGMFAFLTGLVANHFFACDIKGQHMAFINKALRYMPGESRTPCSSALEQIDRALSGEKFGAVGSTSADNIDEDQLVNGSIIVSFLEVNAIIRGFVDKDSAKGKKAKAVLFAIAYTMYTGFCTCILYKSWNTVIPYLLNVVGDTHTMSFDDAIKQRNDLDILPELLIANPILWMINNINYIQSVRSSASKKKFTLQRSIGMENSAPVLIEFISTSPFNTLKNLIDRYCVVDFLDASVNAIYVSVLNLRLCTKDTTEFHANNAQIVQALNRFPVDVRNPILAAIEEIAVNRKPVCITFADVSKAYIFVSNGMLKQSLDSLLSDHATTTDMITKQHPGLSFTPRDQTSEESPTQQSTEGYDSASYAKSQQPPSKVLSGMPKLVIKKK